jgi:signal transduction histidine kinase
MPRTGRAADYGEATLGPDLPGARTSCALLTIFTILLAWPSPSLELAVVVRPCYFALLSWFFWRTGRESPELQGQAMRLVRSGFLVLSVGFTLSAIIHFGKLEPMHAGFVYLREACERGALFLLGTTLLSYGLMLWIPSVLASHRLLGAHNARQSSELQVAATARSQLEQRLVDADRRGMLGELAASIAHDLRNPLTIVKGTAESLCRRGHTSAEIAEHTNIICRNIEKADRTIASLIDLARPRASTPADVRAHDVLQEIKDLLQVAVRRHKTTIAVERVAPEQQTIVRVDRALLSQALLNLVLNAAQASGNGGSILLRVRAVRRAGRKLAVLCVEDRGSGLPAELRIKLFTPFFTTKQNGTGLGLLSCRRIAGELGGRLGLYPRHRGGTRALLLLPRAGDNDSQAAAGPADETPRCLVNNC